MAVIGSTEDGEIGTAETEIRAFQPFFAELDPPRVLTQGDRISLPVVLRNYLDRNQTVNLELKPESWFTIDGPNQTKTQIAAGDSAIKTFNFQAQSSIRDGKQRVTALGSEYSDAIEKPVSVHPWSLVFGLWSLVFGLWSLVFGLWSLVFGLWSLVFDLSL